MLSWNWVSFILTTSLVVSDLYCQVTRYHKLRFNQFTFTGSRFLLVWSLSMKELDGLLKILQGCHQAVNWVIISAGSLTGQNTCSQAHTGCRQNWFLKSEDIALSPQMLEATCISLSDGPLHRQFRAQQMDSSRQEEKSLDPVIQDSV